MATIVTRGLVPSQRRISAVDTATGTLAGNYWPTFGGIRVGFFYQNGKFTSLPWSDASGSPSYSYTLTALNNTGIVVGTFLRNYVQGFVYQKGKMTVLEYPGANYTYFQGVNDWWALIL